MAKAPTDIRSLARAHTSMALRTLKAIAANPKANTSARVAAAVALLDRGWGKPKQDMSIDGKLVIDAIDYNVVRHEAEDTDSRGLRTTH